MKPLRTGLELKIAVSAMLFGSLAAPVYHVASSVFAPHGFADMRGERVWFAPLVLLIAWLWSAGHTFVVGGIVWPLLHWKDWDGTIAYIAVALFAAIGLSLVLSGQLPSWELPIMAVLNASAVRLAEVHLRSTWGKGRDV